MMGIYTSQKRMYPYTFRKNVALIIRLKLYVTAGVPLKECEGSFKLRSIA